MALNVTKEVIKAFGNYKGHLPRLEVVADELLEVDLGLAKRFKQHLLPSHYDEITGIDDIVIKRSTLISCFQECYKTLYMGPKSSNDSPFFAALGILLISAEDHTALNICWEMMQHSQEKRQLVFKVITLYLTCSISRTNKSSSLWLYYRKFIIYFILKDPECQETLSKRVLDVIMLSIKIHKRSYYACYTLRFMIALIRLANRYELLQYYNDTIFRYLKTEGLNDMSMWQIWAQLLLNLDDENYYLFSIQKLGYSFNSHAYKIPPNVLLFYYHQLIEWLVFINYRFYPGWYVAIHLAWGTGNAKKMKIYLEKEIANYEGTVNLQICQKPSILFYSEEQRAANNSDIIRKELSDRCVTFKRLYYTFYITGALCRK